MSGPRYERVLASTALALMLAAPIGAAAQDAGAPATAPAAVAPAGQPLSESGRVPTPSEPAATPAEAAAVAGAAALSGAPAAPSAGTSETGAAPAAIASEQTAAPDPLATLDPADRAVAEKIRDLLAAKSDKIFANKRERAAVETFYQARHLAPLWLDKGIENARAQAVIAHLKGADADGLDVSDYKPPAFAGLSPDALAEAELKLTQIVLTYARHLQAGRFPYTRVSHNIELPQAPPDPAEVLGKIAQAANAGAALEDFSPPHEGYKKLKAMLAQLRGKASPVPEIADGPLLKLNPKAPMEDPRVPQLRAKLGLGGDASDLKYDSKLAEAVKKFQRANDLPVTGNLDARTLKELNGPTADRQIESVISNMERWRWYPRDLGNAYVIVNLPDFSLRVMHNGAQAWNTRIVIGKTDMPTPLLSETMKYITINPTWNVPPSIVQNEYLPALQQDPTVLERMGLKLVYNRDGSVHIYQPPGEANALGRIRFNFPNKFLVYQHDTPDKHLFAKDKRAFSHGCMRVQFPDKYAELLLSISNPKDGYTIDKIHKMYGTGERDIHLTTPIPVHLTYQTAFVDDAGHLVIREDVYGRDARLLAALKGEDRRIADNPIEHRDAGISQKRQASRLPVPSSSPLPSFFGGLFR